MVASGREHTTGQLVVWFRIGFMQATALRFCHGSGITALHTSESLPLRSEDPPVVTVISEPNLTYSTDGGLELQMDMLYPEPASNVLRPAIVWVHGGGW